jgi:two-component system nitrogen regulation response regulator GlnG
MNSTPCTPAKVLIVDDLEEARWVLSNLIQQAGFEPVMATNGEEALAHIRQEAPDVMLLDVRLPDMDGFEVLTQAKAHDKTVPVIMVTAYGKTSDAVRAMRAGAYDYVAKPFINEDIVLTVRRALEEKASRRQLRQILDLPRQAGSLLDSMGTSAVVRHILREMEQVASTNFSVLVTGETGTGKELVAQAVHAVSPRATKPFVAVDCGAIPESLIESELFGHEKGAFTGAHHAKAGAFELAGEGTIFLDEIGNLPLAMQGKLLRVLEERKIHRIGSTHERDVDFRVVAATNLDLRAMMDQQAFRRDLYHRLAEFTIFLPPLRERTEDLPFLVNRFLALANKELSKQVGGLSGSAWGIIQQYNWPGNARELRNQLRRAVLLCNDPEGLVSPENLGVLDARRSPSECLGSGQAERDGGSRAYPLLAPAALLASGASPPLKELVRRVTAQVERAILLQTLELTDGNKAQAARLLHIDYKTIQSKLKAYGISSTQFMRDAYKLRDAEVQHSAIYIGEKDMVSKKRSEEFAEGKHRIEEIGRRLGALFGKPKPEPSGSGGFFAGLGTLIEQLGKLAEQAEQAGGVVTKTGEFRVGSDKRLKGVYGFSVKSGLGEKGLKVEPFGNIRKDAEGGLVEVHEIGEPMVDVFDEPDHMMIVAEVPGIRQEDVQLELHEDILILAAERGEKKYRKEVLLPASFSSDKMSFTCRNGILEIRLIK